LKNKNIFIDNDLTWKERQMQNERHSIAKAEKKKGSQNKDWLQKTASKFV